MLVSCLSVIPLSLLVCSFKWSFSNNNDAYNRLLFVVGKPIPVPKLEADQKEPTHEQLVAVQEEYIKGLEAIYNKYKDVYAKDRKQDLRIVD